MKEYKLTDFFGVVAPDNCCLFCDQCSDIWWDYTHGPYMFFCDIGKDTSKGAHGECEFFLKEDIE